MPFIPVTNAPTVQGANLVGSPVQLLDDDQINIRGDYLLSERHSLFGRYSWQDTPLLPASLVPLGGQQVISKGNQSMMQWTSALSPALVNVFRASYSYAQLFGQQVVVDRDLASEIGILNVSTVERNWGTPTVGWQGFSSIGSNGLTQGNVINNYEISDSVSLVKGGHSLKFGGSSQRRQPP